MEVEPHAFCLKVRSSPNSKGAIQKPGHASAEAEDGDLNMKTDDVCCISARLMDKVLADRSTQL